jgi:CheY-like chemotaxis protein
VLFISENPMQTQAMSNAADLVGIKLKAMPNLQNALEWVQGGGKSVGTLLDFPRGPIDRLVWLEFVKSMGLHGVPCAALLRSDDPPRLLSQEISEAFSAIYVKPMTPLQLQSVFRGSHSHGMDRTGFSNTEMGKWNLLIVDDSELNLKVLEGILRRKQANITKAYNGLEALSFLLQFGHGFDAVVMDVQMPLMDGLEATHELRKHPFNADLPVIGLTGEVSPEDKRRALQAGMSAVLHKPLQPDELIFLLSNLIKPPG